MQRPTPPAATRTGFGATSPARHVGTTPSPPPRRHRWVRGLAAAVLVSAVALAGGWPPPARAQAISVRDDRGTEHRLPAPARRIVSLMPSLTEIVAALGGTARLVGVDRFSDHPASVAALPKVGDIDAVAVETIVALKPDVVLASTGSRGLDRLEALGLVVVRLQSDRHADIRRSLDIVARLLGQPDAGERAWREIRATLDAAAARVPAGWRDRSVYFEVGAGPYAAGTVSFIGETLAALGLANIVTPDLGPFPKLNPEFVLRARPAVVMGPQRDVDTMRERPGWSMLPALRDGRRCRFAAADYDRLVRPGPRLGDAAATIADCLQRLEPPR